MGGFLDRIGALKDRRRMEKLSSEKIERAVALFSVEDLKLRFFVGDLVYHQGARSVPHLLKGIRSETVEVRRSSVFVLGKLARRLKEEKAYGEVVDTLCGALEDGDPKVRKNSAVVLGDLRVSHSVEALIQALNGEEMDWVKPSLVLALGAIGSDRAVEFLSQYSPVAEAEQDALLRALDHTAKVTSSWKFLGNLPGSLPVELRTYRGLEAVLEQEVREKLSLEPRSIQDGVVAVETDDLYKVFSLRTLLEILIPRASVKIGSSGMEEVRDRVSRLFERGDLFEEVLSWHADGGPHIRYRIEIRGKRIKHYMRRLWIRAWVRQIQAVAPRFINSPSHYDLEIRVTVRGGEARLLVKPFTIPDERFHYRVRDVPAAIHPVVAAGLIRLLPELRSEARVLDPFCGSGTILVERGLAGGCEEQVGIDVSQRAVEAAECNVAASGLEGVRIVKDDVRNLSAYGRFDEIITNMPFGIRVGSHATNVKLYREFFDAVPHALTVKGLLVLYTQEIQLTQGLFKRSRNLKLSKVCRIEAGGLMPGVFIGHRSH